MTNLRIDEKTFDLLIECQLQLDEIARLVKEFVSKKYPGKEITNSAVELLAEQRKASRLANKVGLHLQDKKEVESR